MNEPLLDIEVIERVKTASIKRGPEFWKSLVNNFLTHSSTLISEIKQAYQLGHIDQMLKVLHKLKGTTASFGASALAQCCQEIENHCAKSNNTEIKLLVSQLENCIKQKMLCRLSWNSIH
ncbi:Hpt domain-containing protein [Candidatus Parabeggiatoa sp. HSG14]|uniref:Hpt domain-containing protein n=1 Tax=Candidatus Parabeggiatoa sp. HSG14 TaxID=3055593 RepID=UPI0025A6A802|nr:Hpt domain-containing protein [Thiotrichales bacterium HSG14]